MRHQNTGRQLSRNSAHRGALMRNMATALLRHETIRTTLPKAKELRRVVEPLITLAKQDSVAKRRLAFARLRDDAVVAKLFTDLGPHYQARPGGYTRILKHGFRAGDKAPMAVMQLVGRETAAAVSAKAPAAQPVGEKARTDKKPKIGKPAKAENTAAAANADEQTEAEKKTKAKEKTAGAKAGEKPKKSGNKTGK